MRYHYGFEFKSKRDTTTGSPNPNSGRLSIAGTLVCFSSVTQVKEWISSGIPTATTRGNPRYRINKLNVRDLFHGMPLDKFNQMINDMEEDAN